MELGRLGLKNGSIVYLRSQICFALWKLTDCKAGDHHVKQQIQPVYFSHCRSNDIASELSLDDSWPGHVVQPTSVPEGHPGTAITCEVREEGQ